MLGRRTLLNKTRSRFILFLLNTRSPPFPFILFLSGWRSRKMWKTQVGKDADEHIWPCGCTPHSHSQKLPGNFSWSISHYLPTDPHSSLVVSHKKVSIQRGGSLFNLNCLHVNPVPNSSIGPFSPFRFFSVPFPDLGQSSAFGLSPPLCRSPSPFRPVLHNMDDSVEAGSVGSSLCGYIWAHLIPVSAFHINSGH